MHRLVLAFVVAILLAGGSFTFVDTILNYQFSGPVGAAVAQRADRRKPAVCDGLGLKRSWDGEVRNVSRLVAIGVNDEGFREVLAVAEGSKEDI